MARGVLIFRWAVFLLAAGYCIRTIFFGSYEGFGGPFRYLTIWALFLSFFAASRMLALSEGRSTRRWDAFVSMTAVINAMVLILYWRLYFADPTSVTRDGQLGDLWLELYLHGVGPVLQWIDATFIHRAFRRVGQSLLLLIGVIFAYVVWAEGVVGPMNDTPIGAVTSGLPYPFLNDLDLAGRAIFYGANLAVAVVVLLVFVAISFVVRRLFPRQEVL
ncbi:androgen-induced gene 1 family protein [Pseudooctadecabacter jejudonensis]|uniref:FAR-17a/AIG1-like protein n=1 Tax=Pseudooctadecabacter jejudonensis TaxID=1391910 RepID=A0A1Y5S7Y3_9RHOB|nr:hypothetical protein [Pseudooctadecabacter jejudonensis]SLN34512.1 FAR-17a/AIG1-like protein [Pseudooctadecabacter jejudonensis]